MDRLRRNPLYHKILRFSGFPPPLCFTSVHLLSPCSPHLSSSPASIHLTLAVVPPLHPILLLLLSCSPAQGTHSFNKLQCFLLFYTHLFFTVMINGAVSFHVPPPPSVRAEVGVSCATHEVELFNYRHNIQEPFWLSRRRLLPTLLAASVSASIHCRLFSPLINYSLYINKKKKNNSVYYHAAGLWY